MRYTTFTELEESYAKEEIYPLDLKNAVARELSKVCTVIFFVLDIIVLGKTMCSSGLCISILQTIFLLLHHGACPFLESNLIMGYLESCTVCMMCSDRFLSFVLHTYSS